ncbi:hypothetical protein AUK22_09840 [bacterium CG2_30_54_10]|nr:MAG: hypothetical protein AUK22_09840 [bacterium CG2_30_54_10]
MATRRDVRPLYEAMVVAVGGPPHSGKTVFLAALYRHILALRPQNFCYLQRMCPDGEGVWSSESDPEVVKEIRCKGKFASTFMTTYLPQLQGLGLMGNFRLILADLGGVPPTQSAENAEILANCTHQIVLCSTLHSDHKAFWLQVAEEEGCQTIAVFDSRLVKIAGTDELDLSVRSEIELGEVPTGEFRNLDRKQEAVVCYEDEAQRLAAWLVERVESR